ncbi:MAG: carboxy-S-adenosyl-L-methionine synthase CmoA [Gammaproteobacteria bacterium]|jgi:tRNA (cmo5U34)-methyltransferase
MSKNRDQIYASQHDMIVDFRFDNQVAAVFPDMIRRSVPGYDTIIPLLGLFAERYVRAGSNVYDLGCSLGAASLAMRRYITLPGCTIIAVDNSEAMINQCRQNLAADDSNVTISLECADIRDVEISNASLVIINFTMQFIEPSQRQPLMDRIYHGMQDGGALVMAEKVVFGDQGQQCFEEDMHLAFKRANGYSDLEISQKRTALEKVLVPETLEAHLARARQAGFSEAYPWLQCFNFAALCAIK